MFKHSTLKKKLIHKAENTEKNTINEITKGEEIGLSIYTPNSREWPKPKPTNNH